MSFHTVPPPHYAESDPAPNVPGARVEKPQHKKCQSMGKEDGDP